MKISKPFFRIHFQVFEFKNKQKPAERFFIF